MRKIQHTSIDKIAEQDSKGHASIAVTAVIADARRPGDERKTTSGTADAGQSKSANGPSGPPFA